MDFISIIIPAYNAERWLGRCIDSIIVAADADCEVIIVDDGSTDSTPLIARRYADMDPRISTITISHCGPNAARKAGFLESQGDYVMFVDSDDIIKPNSIRTQRRLSIAPTKAALEEDMANPTGERRCTDGRPLMIIANTTERIGDNSRLKLTGHRRALTGNEFALEYLHGSVHGFLPGHFYDRQLLESIEWDDDPSITHHDFPMLMLSMAMKLRDMANEGVAPARLILIEPTLVCYEYLRRPGSQTVMMALTHEGLNRVWRLLCALNLPEPEFSMWGLKLIQLSFIERGIQFSNDFAMARDLLLRSKLLGDRLPEKYHTVVEALSSASKRKKIARRLSRTGNLTSITPHISFLIICHGDAGKVMRSVKSIFNTGLRNLEVILVDWDNDHSTSVHLNEMCITYPRMQVVKADANKNYYNAMRTGVSASTGLALSFVRPGDLVGAEGVYDAVRSIDYGADLVLVNTRRQNRLLRIYDSTTSFSYLSQLSETPHNLYDTFVQRLTDNQMGREFLGYGMVWRREILTDTGLDPLDYDGFSSPELTRKMFLALLKKPIRVIAQDINTQAAYVYSVRSILHYSFTGRLFTL